MLRADREDTNGVGVDSIVLWIGGAWLLLRVLPLFFGFLQLLRVTLQPTRYRHISADEVDEETRALLEASATPLLSVGFEAVGFFRARRILKTVQDESDGLALLHAASGTLATVQLSEVPERWNPTSVMLCTVMEDRCVLTMNGTAHGLIGAYPAEVEDPYAGSFDAVWRFHEHRLKGAAGRLGSFEEVLAATERRDRGYLEGMVAGGLARPRAERDDTFELTARGALIGAWRAVRGGGRVRRMQVERKRDAQQRPEAYPEVPLEVELATYRRYEEIRRSPNRRQLLALIFGATAVLFGLSMLRLFDPIEIGVLVAVVFFHELGHYVAMRVFSYQDTTIFFIPFLGAAATGRKDTPSLAEEMVILLAGPMPGLLLGGALALVPQVMSSEVGQHAVLMLISLNLFNLLPVFPLDGGRIAHALVFAGRPWPDLLFKLAAVLAFAGLGWFAGEGVVVVIALFVGLTIPLGFRTSRLEAEFRREESVEAPPDRVRWIFERLRRAPSPMAYSQKVAVVRQLEQRLAHEAPTWWRTIPWLGVYGGCFAAGLFAVGIGFSGSTWREPEPEAIAVGCPVDPAALPDGVLVTLSCEAPDTETALGLQERLVVASAGASFCVPAPWQEPAPTDAQKRALLTMRIVNHRIRRTLAGKDGDDARLRDLDALIEERADDPGFDHETARLLRARLALEDQDEARAAWRALRARVGGREGDCPESRVLHTAREDQTVDLMVRREAMTEAAGFLCEAGCTSLSASVGLRTRSSANETTAPR